MSGEIKRRLVHVSGTGFPALYLLDLVTWHELRLLLVFGSLAALVLEIIRLYVGLDWKIYDELTREYEQDNLAGYALYFFGMTVTAWAFQPQIAIPAMLMLTIADPISGLLGSGELGIKAVHTLLATFGVCVAIASIFGLPVPAAILGAVAATLADGVKPVIAGYVIDDNLTIPIGAGVAIFVGLQYIPAIV
ncbi:Dolichol kinase [Haladaptatus litoreus]|uniref:Dolichol kinase n=1 Tax=Haladaptatus litoreus TaxID=553468 RepID=A0A1N7BRP2_9EURY|nr:dolichol kinase [Haladaptatus litoreus]SIR54021.1 Dolichol kinase [Haladaptatus litoreus]